MEKIYTRESDSRKIYEFVPRSRNKSSEQKDYTLVEKFSPPADVDEIILIGGFSHNHEIDFATKEFAFYHPNLKCLTVDQCNFVESLIVVNTIEKLVVYNNNKLKFIKIAVHEKESFDEFSGFPNLKYLSLSEFGNGVIPKQIYEKFFTNPNNFPSLEYLEFVGAKEIDTIPIYPKLKSLICHYSDISSIPIIPTLIELNVGSCRHLREIPIIEGLEILVCFDDITKIPSLPNLRELNCRHCTRLKEIGDYPALEKLDCYGCESLEYVPLLPKLKEFEHRYCFNLIHGPEVDSFGRITGQPYNYKLDALIA